MMDNKIGEEGGGMAEDIYKQELLEHYRNPHNYGLLKDASVRYHDFNPLCGDEIEIFLKINQKKVEAVAFTGRGCAISQAAASLLTDHLKGKSIEEIRRMSAGDMLRLLPIEVSHLRIKCALLAFKAAQKGIALRGTAHLQAKGKASKESSRLTQKPGGNPSRERKGFSLEKNKTQNKKKKTEKR